MMSWVKTQKENEVFDCVAFGIKKLDGARKTLLEGLIPTSTTKTAIRNSGVLIFAKVTD